MTYKPPQADSPELLDHVCTLQSCHGAVVAPLSDVPQEGSSVFSLSSLIKLHLASLPLASSYSRVAVSSVFWAQNIYFFGPNTWGPVKPPYATESVPSLWGHAIAYRWRSLPRVRRRRASKPQGSSKWVLPWQVTIYQVICASLSNTRCWYKVGMLKVPVIYRY